MKYASVCTCERARERMCICVHASLCKSLCCVHNCESVCMWRVFKCVFSRMCLHTSFYLCAVGLRGAHSHPYSCGLGVHLHSESQQLSPLLLWLCTANACTHSCRASYVWLQLFWRAHGRHSNCHREPRPWSVSWSELDSHHLCELLSWPGKKPGAPSLTVCILPSNQLDMTSGSFRCQSPYLFTR